ncbi:hypothetical protein BDF14DRAFT_1748070 [Spinellus fusiger]|nr:hypothetical protein BDF14DRAFT_1748070 [Spinellus fusiger]
MSRYQKLPHTDDPLHAHTHLTDEIHLAELEEESSSRTRPTDQQHNDLEASFDEHFDTPNETEHLLPYQPTSSSLPLRPAVLPVSNDGVFSNMSAKPESERVKVDETPPAYNEAAADATPPYWQTTIIAPAGMGDYVLVEGMPVGSLLGFVWNLLVSASFQFVGFMLTYLLHTSHAAKQGSRAGLGISLVQTGFYIRSRGTLNDDFDFENKTQDSTDANIISYFLMIIGWFIIVRSLADYVRARKMESIIAAEPTAEGMV